MVSLFPLHITDCVVFLAYVDADDSLNAGSEPTLPPRMRKLWSHPHQPASESMPEGEIPATIACDGNGMSGHETEFDTETEGEDTADGEYLFTCLHEHMHTHSRSYIDPTFSQTRVKCPLPQCRPRLILRLYPRSRMHMHISEEVRRRLHLLPQERRAGT